MSKVELKDLILNSEEDDCVCDPTEELGPGTAADEGGGCCLEELDDSGVPSKH